MHKTVAVIGHVDHGKTALVKALTGTNTDRLEAERKRGLSIVLGFANYETADGWLHFIDAPGHADFIQTAASGLSGVDAILLAIALNEGPSRQTIEHLKLAQLFGIRDAVVALTKSDLSAPHTGAIHLNTIHELLDGHGFNSPSIVECSSYTMDGVDTLRNALGNVLAFDRPRTPPKSVFLPVDRVFSIEGAGTVVTGTLLGGGLNIDDPLAVQPTGLKCSVRGLQIAGQSAHAASAGARVALNLRNVKAREIKPGYVLCAPGRSKPSRLFDVSIDPPAPGVRKLSHMEEITVLFGTKHCSARVRLLPCHAQEPIASQLEFHTDQVGFAGQRFVIRRPASFETVSGGEILDPEARLVRRHKDQHADVLIAAATQDPLAIARAISERDSGCVELSMLERLARNPVVDWTDVLKPEFILSEDRLALSMSLIEALKIQLIEATKAQHADRPRRPHAPSPYLQSAFKRVPRALLDYALQSLIDDRRIELRLNGIALTEHDPKDALSDLQHRTYEETLERLRETGLMPEPSRPPNGADQDCDDLLDHMIWNEHAVRLYNHSLKQTLVLHSETIHEAIMSLKEAFPGKQPFKTGEARDVLSTNRKTIVPLLEHLDACGITRREGDSRVINVTDTPN